MAERTLDEMARAMAQHGINYLTALEFLREVVAQERQAWVEAIEQYVSDWLPAYGDGPNLIRFVRAEAERRYSRESQP